MTSYPRLAVYAYFMYDQIWTSTLIVAKFMNANLLNKVDSIHQRFLWTKNLTFGGAYNSLLNTGKLSHKNVTAP